MILVVVQEIEQLIINATDDSSTNNDNGSATADIMIIQLALETIIDSLRPILSIVVFSAIKNIQNLKFVFLSRTHKIMFDLDSGLKYTGTL